MTDKQIDVNYFLDFFNNDCAIWSIRIILLIGIISVLGYYFYSHRKYKDEHEKEEGGK